NGCHHSQRSDQWRSQRHARYRVFPQLECRHRWRSENDYVNTDAVNTRAGSARSRGTQPTEAAMKNEKGTSLLEVMLASVMMVTIVLAVGTATAQTNKSLLAGTDRVE